MEQPIRNPWDPETRPVTSNAQGQPLINVRLTYHKSKGWAEALPMLVHVPEDAYLAALERMGFLVIGEPEAGWAVIDWRGELAAVVTYEGEAMPKDKYGRPITTDDAGRKLVNAHMVYKDKAWQTERTVPVHVSAREYIADLRALGYLVLGGPNAGWALIDTEGRLMGVLRYEE